MSRKYPNDAEDPTYEAGSSSGYGDLADSEEEASFHGSPSVRSLLDESVSPARLPDSFLRPLQVELGQETTVSLEAFVVCL